MCWLVFVFIIVTTTRSSSGHSSLLSLCLYSIIISFINHIVYYSIINLSSYMFKLLWRHYLCNSLALLLSLLLMVIYDSDRNWYKKLCCTSHVVFSCSFPDKCCKCKKSQWELLTIKDNKLISRYGHNGFTRETCAGPDPHMACTRSSCGKRDMQSIIFWNTHSLSLPGLHPANLSSLHPPTDVWTE